MILHYILKFINSVTHSIIKFVRLKFFRILNMIISQSNISYDLERYILLHLFLGNEFSNRRLCNIEHFATQEKCRVLVASKCLIRDCFVQASVEMTYLKIKYVRQLLSKYIYI